MEAGRVLSGRSVRRPFGIERYRCCSRCWYPRNNVEALRTAEVDGVASDLEYWLELARYVVWIRGREMPLDVTFGSMIDGRRKIITSTIHNN